MLVFESHFLDYQREKFFKSFLLVLVFYWSLKQRLTMATISTTNKGKKGCLVGDDSFEGFLCATIGSSLKVSEIRTLEQDPETWNDQLHMKCLLSIYVTLIGVPSIRIRIVESRLQEPITLYTYESAEASTRSNEYFNQQPIHAVSLEYVKLLFARRPSFKLRVSHRPIKEYKIPKIFSLHCIKKNLHVTQYNEAFHYSDCYNLNSEDEDILKLSPTLSRKLLLLYMIAEHAAFHYFIYEKYAKLDYEHREKHAIPGRLFLHELISTRKNSKIEKLILQGARSNAHKPIPGILVYESDDNDDDDDDNSENYKNKNMRKSYDCDTEDEKDDDDDDNDDDSDDEEKENSN